MVAASDHLCKNICKNKEMKKDKQSKCGRCGSRYSGIYCPLCDVEGYSFSNEELEEFSEAFEEYADDDSDDGTVCFSPKQMHDRRRR